MNKKIMLVLCLIPYLFGFTSVQSAPNQVATTDRPAVIENALDAGVTPSGASGVKIADASVTSTRAINIAEKAADKGASSPAAPGAVDKNADVSMTSTVNTNKQAANQTISDKKDQVNPTIAKKERKVHLRQSTILRHRKVSTTKHNIRSQHHFSKSTALKRLDKKQHANSSSHRKSKSKQASKAQPLFKRLKSMSHHKSAQTMHGHKRVSVSKAKAKHSTPAHKFFKKNVKAHPVKRKAISRRAAYNVQTPSKDLSKHLIARNLPQKNEDDAMYAADVDLASEVAETTERSTVSKKPFEQASKARSGEIVQAQAQSHESMDPQSEFKIVEVQQPIQASAHTLNAQSQTITPASDAKVAVMSSIDVASVESKGEQSVVEQATNSGTPDNRNQMQQQFAEEKSKQAYSDATEPTSSRWFAARAGRKSVTAGKSEAAVETTSETSGRWLASRMGHKPVTANKAEAAIDATSETQGRWFSARAEHKPVAANTDVSATVSEKSKVNTFASQTETNPTAKVENTSADVAQVSGGSWLAAHTAKNMNSAQKSEEAPSQSGRGSWFAAHTAKNTNSAQKSEEAPSQSGRGSWFAVHTGKSPVATEIAQQGVNNQQFSAAKPPKTGAFDVASKATGAQQPANSSQFAVATDSREQVAMQENRAQAEKAATNNVPKNDEGLLGRIVHNVFGVAKRNPEKIDTAAAAVASDAPATPAAHVATTSEPAIKNEVVAAKPSNNTDFDASLTQANVQRMNQYAANNSQRAFDARQSNAKTATATQLISTPEALVQVAKQENQSQASTMKNFSQQTTSPSKQQRVAQFKKSTQARLTQLEASSAGRAAKFKLASSTTHSVKLKTAAATRNAEFKKAGSVCNGQFKKTCSAHGAQSGKACAACTAQSGKSCAACNGQSGKACAACTAQSGKSCAACSGQSGKACAACTAQSGKSCAACNGQSGKACAACTAQSAQFKNARATHTAQVTNRSEQMKSARATRTMRFKQAAKIPTHPNKEIATRAAQLKKSISTRTAQLQLAPKKANSPTVARMMPAVKDSAKHQAFVLEAVTAQAPASAKRHTQQHAQRKTAGNVVAISNASADEKKLMRLQAKHFTLQLMANSDLNKIHIYQRENPALSPTWIYSTKADNNGKMYFLVYGDFSSNDDAQSALFDLPIEWQRWMPFAKQVTEIHSQINSRTA